jgi:hypothetical protein
MTRRSKWLDCAWVAHRLDLVQSPSWRLAPIPLRRLLDRLEIEHMRHGGKLNGHLFVAYSQFEFAGMSRRKISAALTLGERLGLVEVIRANEPKGDLRAPNSYRLTYLPAKGAERPGDEWKRITEDRAAALVEAYHGIEHSERKPGLRGAA